MTTDRGLFALKKKLLRWGSALILGIFITVAAVPGTCRAAETAIKFKHCDQLDVPRIHRYLKIEIPPQRDTHVKAIRLTCEAGAGIDIFLITTSGYSTHRNFNLNNVTDSDPERVLALFVTEMIAEESSSSYRPQDTSLDAKASERDAAAPKPSPHPKPERLNQRRPFNAIGGMAVWQHMPTIDAVGPSIVFIHTHRVGLGWQVAVSALFAADATVAGDVKTIVASAGILPFMWWQHGRMVWRLGAGFRAGLVRLKGIPKDDSTLSGHAIVGEWYGPFALMDAGIAVKHFLLMAGIEAGYAFAAVVGQAAGTEIGVNRYWLRPGVIIGVIF